MITINRDNAEWVWEHWNMTHDEIEDLFEAVTGHNIAHGDRSQGRAMYLSSDEVIDFSKRIAAHERETLAQHFEQFRKTEWSAEAIAYEIRARGEL